GAGYLKRADTEKLHEIFLKYATVEKNGEKCITSEDFVRKYLGLFDEDDYNKESVKLIAGIVDMDKDGFISFSEFQAFEGLLCVPDAFQFLHDFHEEYGVEAFKKCDSEGSGFISAADFKEIMMSVKNHLLTKDLKTKVINISFPYYMAFNSLLNNMELIKRVYLNATNGHRTQEVTKE
ncbi:putative mitochondrial solute carrier, partial [Operophtera brumata]